MKSEKQIQNEILVELASKVVLFRTNAGSFWQGQITKLNGIRCLINLVAIKGLPKGHADLTGVRISDGKAVYIETKKDGKNATEEQALFLRRMREYNAIAGVAHSVEEALELVKE
jgi:hypothetical protein